MSKVQVMTSSPSAGRSDRRASRRRDPNATIPENPIRLKNLTGGKRHPDELRYNTSYNWPASRIIGYLKDNAFSVPGQPKSQRDPWTVITSADGTETRLPSKYRIPLMFVAQFQWMSLRLILPPQSDEWKDWKYDILHVSILCSTFLAQARHQAEIGLMHKNWRCPTFDRPLVRYFLGWMLNRDEQVAEFDEEFGGDAIYSTNDILDKDWRKVVLQGHKGFQLTQNDLQNGITAEQFTRGLQLKDEETPIWPPVKGPTNNARDASTRSTPPATPQISSSAQSLYGDAPQAMDIDNDIPGLSSTSTNNLGLSTPRNYGARLGDDKSNPLSATQADTPVLDDDDLWPEIPGLVASASFQADVNSSKGKRKEAESTAAPSESRSFGNGSPAIEPTSPSSAPSIYQYPEPSDPLEAAFVPILTKILLEGPTIEASVPKAVHVLVSALRADRITRDRAEEARMNEVREIYEKREEAILGDIRKVEETMKSLVGRVTAAREQSVSSGLPPESESEGESPPIT